MSTAIITSSAIFFGYCYRKGIVSALKVKVITFCDSICFFVFLCYFSGMDNELKEMGKRILAIMKDAGLTRDELGDILGVGPGAVGKYIRGESSPGQKKLKIIANLGETTIDWLLTGNGPGPAIDRTKLSPTEQVLIKPAGSRPVYSSTALPWNNETAEYVAESSWPQNTAAMIRFISASLPFLREDQITALFSEIKGFMLESQAEEKNQREK